MIDQVDARLIDWTRSLLPETDVSLAAPGEVDKGRVVSLYLMEMINAPASSSARRSPLQVSLRYLVTTRSDEPGEAHRLLGELMFAAMESPEFDVQSDPIPIDVWRAFGVVPRPAFVLRVPLRLERPKQPAQLVRQPLVIKRSSIASLQGTVYGPGDIPLMGATVEVPAVSLSTRTDSNGRFSFSALPKDPPTTLVLVKAKGREMSVSAEQAVLKSEPLIIRLEGMEV